MRTKVLNNELEDVFRRLYPRFRQEAHAAAVKRKTAVNFPNSGSDSGLVQEEWAREQQRGADERGAIRSRRGHTFAA
jgi:hypothetical protein